MNLILEEVQDNLKHNEPGQTIRGFHGRGGSFNDFSHVTIDCFGKLFYVRFFEKDPREDDLCQKLVDYFSVGVVLHKRYENSFKLFNTTQEQVDGTKALELGLSYNLKIGHNQNPGFFLDMKEGRKWLASNSNGKRVLNLFSYTCSLSVVAAKFDASSVDNVDVSSSFLNWGRENHHLNELSCENIKFHKKDVLKSLGWLSKRGPFDIVIYDPPSFQKSRFDYKKDYKKVVRSASKLVSKGGYILSCLNTPFEKTDFIVDLYKELAPEFTYIETLVSPKEFKEVDKLAGVKIVILQRS